MGISQDLVKKQKAYFEKGTTLSLDFRRAQLEKLKDLVENHQEEISQALYLDLGKSSFEAYETEIGLVLGELKDTLKHLRAWARPKRVPSPLSNFPARSARYPEPYGRVLIMSPWNYPFQLALVPLIGALAAGNCAILKPSNYSKHTSALLKKLLGQTFEEDYVAVLEGGREANKDLLDQAFDYIFFTGSPRVGREVMAAAAKHLTPVTLELGGKSPTIVEASADLDLAAKRIIWGKLINAGQTCIAPDYVLVQEEVKAPLLDRMVTYIEKFYGEDVFSNPHYPHIINEKHFNRLQGLYRQDQVFYGGQARRDLLKIQPTLLDKVSLDAPVMGEEIFGPLLPVLSFKGLEDLEATIKARPKPLALYLFTKDKAFKEAVLRRISFGGGCINDSLVHFNSHTMPFGGVGASGMGAYHGKFSFETFSHYKSITHRGNFLDINLRYPPFDKSLKWLKIFLK
ncbi:MAG: aldehyde dehydrogenase [Tissierellia bacterium]|nr:aldehyde dehydrogenase [Tissierellia bacterium]